MGLNRGYTGAALGFYRVYGKWYTEFRSLLLGDVCMGHIPDFRLPETQD